MSIDDRFVSVGERVPAFGGMFVEGDVLNVYLTDPGSAAAAKEAIRKEFGRNKVVRPLLRRGIRPVPATYAFRTLETWHRQLDPVAFAHTGVIFTDVDDSENGLTLGVTCEITEEVVMQILAQAGVPRGAVNVEIAEAPDPLLADFHRPLVGGLQLLPDIDGSGFCTLGFIAERRPQVGFVTNSHCTAAQGSVDATLFFQPSDAVTPPKGFDKSDLTVGVELIDPPFITCLGLGPVCRYADAAFVNRTKKTKVSFGRVAIEHQMPPIWDGQSTFRIVDEFSSFEGLPVLKTGRTSGTTSGSVDDVCLNQLMKSPPRVELCANIATLFSAKGDSGSPVVIAVGGDDVFLTGLLWGGIDDRTWFSDIELTESVIDPQNGLKTCAPQFAC